MKVVKWLDQKQENIYFSKGKCGFVAIYINEEIDNNIRDKYKINRDKVILGNRLWEIWSKSNSKKEYI